MPVSREIIPSGARALPALGPGDNELLRLDDLEPGPYLVTGSVSLELSTYAGAASIQAVLFHRGRQLDSASGGIESVHAPATSFSVMGLVDITGPGNDATVRLVVRASTWSLPEGQGQPAPMLISRLMALRAVPVAPIVSAIAAEPTPGYPAAARVATSGSPASSGGLKADPGLKAEPALKADPGLKADPTLKADPFTKIDPEVKDDPSQK